MSGSSKSYSIGFHTLSVYLKRTVKDLDKVQEVLESNKKKFYPVKSDSSKTYPVVFTRYYYTEMYKGLSWRLMKRYSSPRYTGHVTYHYDNPDDPDNPREEDRPCSITAKINPKYLVKRDTKYTTAADSSYIEPMIEKFNHEASKISPILEEFDSYSLSRNDYCINFDLANLEINSFPETYMNLIKQGDIPPHFTEYKKYDENDVSHRKKSDGDSFYLKNKSLNINCYNKYAQMKKQDPDNPDLEKYRYIIRFEIQCKYLKIRYMMKQIKDCDGIKEVLHALLDDDVCTKILLNYYNKTIGMGDYYSLKDARNIVKSKNYHRNKESRLIAALELVSKRRGIFHAKSHLDGKKLDEFKRSIKDLGEIGVNPVTLPQGLTVKFLPNLMKAYLSELEKQNQIGNND